MSPPFSVELRGWRHWAHREPAELSTDHRAAPAASGFEAGHWSWSPALIVSARWQGCRAFNERSQTSAGKRFASSLGRSRIPVVWKSNPSF